MNSKEFLEEVLKSQSFSGDFDKIYRQFLVRQTKVWEILKIFHRICEDYSINYQLAYGSLLGIIRDGGPIPWDHDVDVFVSFHDKDRLVEALSKELGEGYHFQCLELDKKCRYFGMRVAPKGHTTDQLYFDVFYYIGAPNEPSQRNLFKQEVQRLSEERFSKLVRIDYKNTYWKRIIKLLLNKIMLSHKNILKEEKRFYQLCYQYPIELSDFCVSADSYATWYDFPTKWLTETKIIKTDFGEFRIPINYDDMLTLVYGDFSQIPPISDRIHEVVSHYKL